MAEEKKEKPVKPDLTDKAKAVFEERYQSIAKRLETETNVINRYELKLSLELILDLYKRIFEGN